MGWAPNYVTDGELESFLRIDDTGDNPELALAISSASRAVDRLTRRQFGKTDGAETRTYEAQWDPDEGLWVASIDDLMSVAGLVVTVDGAPLAASDYRLGPRNADKVGRPWVELATATATIPTLGQGRRTIDVTANPWGWTAVPAAIKQGTLLQSSLEFASRNTPFGIAGSPDMGNEMRLLAKLHPTAFNDILSYKRKDMEF